MSGKDPKSSLRRNLDDLKGIVKTRHMNIHKDKENMIDYFRKQKSRSANKNCTTNVVVSKAPGKKSNSHYNQPDHDNYPKKLRTQADIVLNKQRPGDVYTHKAHLNMTLNTKKESEKEDRTKKTQPSGGYFLTADVSSMLKVINKNLKMDNSIQRKRANMMTEEDVERLFENDQNSGYKKKSQSKPKDYLKKDKRAPTHDETEQQLKEATHKIRLEQKSKSRQRRRNILQTDPDAEGLNYSRKMQTMKLNLKDTTQVEDKYIIKKDFAESIKFLEIQEDSQDKLLSALKDDGLVKVEADPSIDKTTKFKEQFVVGKQIGEGAYASVRVAIYKPNNKKVAIKIYEKKKIKQIQRRKSVRREIKILQKIDHKNILKIYDVIETNNHVNIIMEYIPGISLNSYIKSQPNSRTTQKDARKIFAPIIEAIKYLHDLCICHRDIKLENVLLDSKLTPKLIDFGFSTCIENQKRVKMFCGTPSYMAPEIVVKRQYKGSLADIWALGVLLYVVLTGVFPFKGHTDKELYQKICSADYPKIIGVSRSAEHLINSMLTVDPERRITAEQILQHEWIRGGGEKRIESMPAQYPHLAEENNELHTKFQQILNMTKYRKTQQVPLNSSKERQGLAETYKQNIMRYELNKINQLDRQPSPRIGVKPRTCTNRQSHRMNFQHEQLQKSNSKLLQMLKMELKRKDESPDQRQVRFEAAIEQKLTNKRYF